MTQVLVFAAAIAAMALLMGLLSMAATGDRRAFLSGIKLWFKSLAVLAAIAAVFAIIALPIILTLG